MKGAVICGSCKFWEVIEETNGGTGSCHRYPPTKSPDTDDLLGDFFPVTLVDDWCGEYRKVTGRGEWKDGQGNIPGAINVR